MRGSLSTYPRLLHIRGGVGGGRSKIKAILKGCGQAGASQTQV